METSQLIRRANQWNFLYDRDLRQQKVKQEKNITGTPDPLVNN